MKNKWNEMSVIDKTVSVARIALSLAVIVLSALQISGVMNKAINYAVPLLGVYMLILSIQEWKVRKGQAILSICCAVFIFVVSFVVWFGN